MINYIIQVMLFQVLFLIVYDFVLSKETFFTKNRWYLLMSAIMSFCIPFIQIPSFQKVVSNDIRILLPEIVLSPQNMIEKTEVYQNFNGGLIVFWLGFLFFLGLFSFKVYKLTVLIIKNSIEKKDSYTLIMLPNSKKAFSFFNYIFLGTDINELEKEKIISHELIHCKQKHSLDLLFFESLKILMWFNPLLYIYQKRIATVHEYISDAIILKSADKKLYMNTLVNQLFDVENISFVNQFYKHSQLKKRIMMITKEKSNKMKQIKYLLSVPVLLIMLSYSSCNKQQKIEAPTKQLSKFYFGYKDSVSVTDGKKKTYLDTFMGIGGEPEGEEISLDDLHELEKQEYDEYLVRFDSIFNLSNRQKTFFQNKLYRDKKGRALIATIPDYSEIQTTTKISADDGIPFANLDKVPTFPGCSENDKSAFTGSCFNKKIQQHFQKEFNVNLTDSLKLSPGKKRIIMLFKINKEGAITGIKAKAPHPALQEEAVRIIKLLPIMKPGELNGKKVTVKYILPMEVEV